MTVRPGGVGTHDGQAPRSSSLADIVEVVRPDDDAAVAAAMEATGLPVLADDSGITVDGLDGAPGVYTADWAETPDGRDFMQAMRRTWEELEARGVPEPRTAQFRATLLMMWPDGHEELFEGIAPGRLVWPPRGVAGHGYDPIFVPDGHDRTYAEMSAEEKNAISHRADAFRKLSAILA